MKSFLILFVLQLIGGSIAARFIICNAVVDTCTFNKRSIKKGEDIEFVGYHYNTTEEDILIIRFELSTIFEVRNELFIEFPNAQVLEMTSNEVEHIGPLALKGGNDLRTLILDENLIEELGPDIFQHSPELQVINLKSNQIQSVPGSVFAPLSKLEWLDLSSNKMETLLPETFNGNGNLRGINLSQNQLKVLPNNLFQNNLNLRFIYLQENQITAGSFNIFRHLRNLFDLDLTENRCIDQSFKDAGRVNPKIQENMNLCEVHYLLHNRLGNGEQFGKLSGTKDALIAASKRLENLEEQYQEFTDSMNSKFTSMTKKLEVIRGILQSRK